MTEQEEVIERGRAAIQWCYEERPSTPGSAMQILSGRGRSQRSLGAGGRNPAGLSSTRIYAHEDRPAKFSQTPISSGKANGDVIRAIRSLPPLYQSWVYYCYRPGPKAESHGLYTGHMWKHIIENSDLKGVHRQTLAKIMIMFRVQAFGARSYYRFCQWTPGRPVDLNNVITPDMWHQRYSKYWKMIREQMVYVDEATMQAIQHQESE